MAVRVSRWRESSDKDLIEAAQKWARNHKGVSPKVSDWRKTSDPNYPPSWVPINRFNSWNEYLEKAGLSVRALGRPNGSKNKRRKRQARFGYWNRDNIARAMRREQEKTGEWPTYKGWERANHKAPHSRPTSAIVMSRYPEAKNFQQVVDIVRSGGLIFLEPLTVKVTSVTPVTPEGFITTAETAAILGITKRSVRRLMAQGKLGEVRTEALANDKDDSQRFQYFVKESAVKDRLNGQEGTTTVVSTPQKKAIDPEKVPNRAVKAISPRAVNKALDEPHPAVRQDEALLALQAVRSMDSLTESVRELTRVIQEQQVEDDKGGIIRRIFSKTA